MSSTVKKLAQVDKIIEDLKRKQNRCCYWNQESKLYEYSKYRLTLLTEIQLETALKEYEARAAAATKPC